MPFSGIFPRVVDDKRRVAIPKPLRDEFPKPAPKRLYLAQGSFRSLWLLTPDQFEEWGRRLGEHRQDDARVAGYRRLFYGRAESSELDRQGRILIPDRLAEFGGLRNEVLLIGVFNHIQIWDPQRWAEYEREYESQFDATAERVFNTLL